MPRMRGERLSADALRRLVRCDERGYSAAEIAAMLNVSTPTVYRWLKIYDAEGWAGLKYKPRRKQRKPSRTTPPAVAEAILAWVAAEPGLPPDELAERATLLRYPAEPRRKWQHVHPATVYQILREAGWRRELRWVRA